MPEGPEIKNMVHNVENFIGSTLKNIKFISGRYVHHGPPKNFNKIKFPNKINNIFSHGKFIIISLENNMFLYLTMGMTGHLDVETYRNLRIEFVTNNGSFYMDDTRNFGQLNIFLNLDEHKKKLNSLGYDPLGKEKIPKQLFREYFRKFKKDWVIADALMMPKFIAGVGNYLRAEIFYDSGIDPYCQLQEFSDEMIDALYSSTHKIMKHSYNKIINDSYISFKVYNRETCPKGNLIVYTDRKGRRLWYCPKSIKYKCKNKPINDNIKSKKKN